MPSFFSVTLWKEGLSCIIMARNGARMCEIMTQVGAVSGAKASGPASRASDPDWLSSDEICCWVASGRGLGHAALARSHQSNGIR